MLHTRVVVFESLSIRAKSKAILLWLVKITRFIEDGRRDVLRVLLERGEATRFAEGVLLLSDGVIQCHNFNYLPEFYKL